MVNLSSKNKSIVLIDGECEFCNKSALFIIKYDKNDKFRFASQQSQIGKELLLKNNYSETTLSTIILLQEDKIYTKTNGLIEIAKKLVGFPRMFVLLKIIPNPIRDLLYDIFSKNRYRLFGKKNNCKMPSRKIRNKFLLLNEKKKIE